MSSSFHRENIAGYTASGEPFCEDHPIDHIEAVESGSSNIRDARLRFLEILESWAGILHRALSSNNPTAASIAASCYGPMFALGCSCLNGLGMTDIADRFNLSRACISKTCTAFSEMHSLPANRYTKETDTRSTYSRRRIEQVKQSSNGALPAVPAKGRRV